MKLKHLVISIVLLVLSCVAVAAQTNAGAATRSDTPAPALKTDDLLKIRDVQYSQAKRAHRMKQMEALYQQLQDAQAADSQRIEEIVSSAAKSAGIDVAKWIFDADTLKFIPRTAPATEPEKAAPKKSQ